MKNIKPKNYSFIAILCIALSASMWGLDGVVLTPQLHHLPVNFVVFILHALPFAIMNIFLYKRYKDLKTLNLTDKLALFMVAFFGGAIGTLAMVKALFLVQFKALSIVILLQKLQPVFAIALAALLLKEKLNKYYILWASIALLGGYFLTFGWHLPNISAEDNNAKAAMLSIVAAFSFGSSTVFSKRLLHKVDFISATFFRYGATSLLMLLILLVWGGISYIEQCSPFEWQIIGIIALTTGSGAIFLYYYGLTRVPAMLSSLMELFYPITVVILDYFINGVVLSPVQWISAIVMIAAIMRISMQQAKT